MPTIQTILMQLAAATLPALRNFLVLAVAFTALSALAAACNKAPPWWRKPDLSTDLCWAVVPQLLYRFAHTAMLVLGIAALYGITDPDGLDRFFSEGLGPLARLGFWPQVALYLLGSDSRLPSFSDRTEHLAEGWLCCQHLGELVDQGP